MRTCIVSDLHLGAARARDVLRRPGPLAALCEAVAGADRLVLLGDTVELRHGPAREALAVAEPVLAALTEALGAGGEVVVVPGNHDHVLVGPWLEARAAAAVPAPLGLEQRPDPSSSPGLARLARAARGADLTVAYPGLWLRDDVYATHGHYLDRLITLPTLERLAAGAMVRIVGPLGAQAGPDDFEAALAPLYAWIHAVAQTPAHGRAGGRHAVSADAWRVLSGQGPRSPKARAAAAAFPLAVRALNRAGLGPLRADLTTGELRRAGLRAMADVAGRLGLRGEHVIFGHTHRAGPLPGDERSEWRLASGGALHNAGGWIGEPTLGAGGDPEGPYAAGRMLVLEATGPPRLERVTST